MDRPPHILFILTDQLRADCLGCAGHPLLETPSIDRLAAEGMRFANCFTTSPLCVPLRLSLTMGLYPHNSNIWQRDPKGPLATPVPPGGRRVFQRPQRPRIRPVTPFRRGRKLQVPTPYPEVCRSPRSVADGRPGCRRRIQRCVDEGLLPGGRRAVRSRPRSLCR